MDTAYKTTLELDKVLNRAVQLCACQETKEMMQALEPAPTIEDERYDLTQTNAINALLIKNGSPRFGSVREVRRIVAHARKGGILSMGELLEIAATLRNFSGLSQWYGLSEHEMLPTDDLFFALAPQPVLEKQISESIISPEAVPFSWLTSADATPSIASSVFFTLASQWPHIMPSIVMVFTIPCSVVMFRSSFGISFLILLSFDASCIRNRFRRRAFVTTQKLERLIAAAPNIGFSFQPNSGIHTPAASGIPMIL